MPSFKTEKVSLRKTVAIKKQSHKRNVVYGTVSCPELFQSEHEKPATTKTSLNEIKIVVRRNIKEILSHRLRPNTTPLSTCNLAAIAGLIDEDAASHKLVDIFSAFACPQIPPNGFPYNVPCTYNQYANGCYQVTFDKPQLCQGPCSSTNSGMASPNTNSFPICSSCGGYCQKGGQCGCSSCRGWGPSGPCGLCCCCAAPNTNATSGQTFHAPCSPEALGYSSQACIGTVLCSNAAPVDCYYSGSMPDHSACSHGCGCSCCHHGWDSYNSECYQPSNHYGQCTCHCCCCAAQLAPLPNYESAPAHYTSYDSSGWDGNYYGYNAGTQQQYDPSRYYCGCGYHNAPAYQYSTPYEYNYYPNFANSDNAQMPSMQAPVCNAEFAKSSVGAASLQTSLKQPPEPPKCIKNISSPATDVATACFCPDNTKKPAPFNDKSKNADEKAAKPLPPPLWHGINPTLAKNYPFNNTTRKYHKRMTPVNMARASFSSITPQVIGATSDVQEKKNNDEFEMPHVWSFPESYKIFFDRMSKSKQINLKSLNENKRNE